jgi:hypothetical protein
MIDIHGGEKGLVAVTDASEAGCITWWRLSGGLDLEALRKAWAMRALDHAWLPGVPGFPSALRRAVSEMRGPHRLVRSMKNGALAVVDEREVGGILYFSTVLTVQLDKVGRPVFGCESELANETQVRLDFARFQNELIQADVSPWLCGLMDRIEAIALRETGGIYFVPRYRLRVWRDIVEALREASPHHVAQVPALSSREATAAVLDALAQEARRAMENMRREMAEGDLKSRALQNRIAATNEQQRKIAAYGDLFGEQLTAVHAALDELRAELTVAMVRADDEEPQLLAV